MPGLAFWRDFKPVLLLFISLVLAATAVLFMLAARHETIRAMTQAGEQAAVNLLDAIFLDIESQYRELESFRVYSLERYKRRVRDVIGLVAGMAEVYEQEVSAGKLTREEAKRLLLSGTQQLRYGNDDYFFIYDRAGICLSHPTPEMVGKDMSRYRDIQGRQVIPAAWAGTASGQGFFDIIDFARLGGEASERKLVYFTRIQGFDWLLGGGVYIGDIDRDLTRKKEEILADLNRTFSRLRIGQTGYLWLFTGSGDILVHPSLAERDDPGPLAREIMGRFMESVGTGGGVDYLWDRPDDPDRHVHAKTAWMRRFAPLDWYVAATVYKDDLAAPAKAMLHRQSVYLLGILVFCLAGGWIFAAKVTRPLSRLTVHAKTLAANDFASEPGQENILPGLNFPNEIKTLSMSFQEMEDKLASYLARLTETTAAQERFQSELRIAHRIQMDMLPGPAPKDGIWRAIEVSALIAPAKEVGGDLYDYFALDGGEICFLAGDVSGKGVPAALFMAQCKALVRGFIQASGDPGQVMAKVHAELAEGNEECMFVTMFLCLLDPQTGTMRFADAGHNPPYILSAANAPAPVKPPPGIPLGLPFPVVFQTSSLRLEPGETLLIYTDGVTEAQTAKGDFFGTQRLETLLAGLADTSADQVTKAVFSAVEDFEAGAGHADDLTILAVRYLGTAAREGAAPPSLDPPRPGGDDPPRTPSKFTVVA